MLAAAPMKALKNARTFFSSAYSPKKPAITTQMRVGMKASSSCSLT